MPDAILDDISHRRFNPLKGSWVLVSPHRNKRPWQGQVEPPQTPSTPSYDPSCYLCPGNKRAQGDCNPVYQSTFLFVNDFGAVKDQQAEYGPLDEDGSLSSLLLKAKAVTGRCYVLAFSPAHNLTLADLPPSKLLLMIDAWTRLYSAHVSPSSPLLAEVASPTPTSPLPAQPQDDQIHPPKAQYRYMQIFENKGAAMGCSNPHPHGQIWTTTSLPQEVAVELDKLITYRREHEGMSLLEDYAKLESEKAERIVFENRRFLVVCPWWAVWPFEIMIIAKKQKRALTDFDNEDKTALAEAISEVTRRYDNLFETQFPYSMGIHQAPLEGSEEEIEASHFHMHFYPPLLRSATVRKFFVGYELLGEPQRDITPEQAAARLRQCGGELYRQKTG